MDKSWNSHKQLEFFKVVIRSVFAGNTVEIRNELKTDIKDKEESINQMETLRIKVLEKCKRESPNIKPNDKLECIDTAIATLKVELLKLNDKLNQKRIFALQAKWYDKGEKSNKFFFNINKVRQPQKVIATIKDENNEYVGQTENTKGITYFYRKLYRKANS
jgi:hypothetical protein